MAAAYTEAPPRNEELAGFPLPRQYTLLGLGLPFCGESQGLYREKGRPTSPPAEDALSGGVKLYWLW